MRSLRTTACLLLSLVSWPGDLARAQVVPTARTLQLSFEPDGLVTLRAHNVTVREVLAEWARQCGCFVVNAHNLTGGPLTIPVQFEHAPQDRVLESLLRQAAGYVLTPRRDSAAGPSRFETIYILATSNAAAGSYTPPPVPAALPMPTAGSPEDEIPPVIPVPGMPRPGEPQPPAQPAQQPATQPPAPRAPGTPGVFVPIVPIGPAQPSAPAPGTTTPAPGSAPPPPQQPPANAPPAPGAR
jgi:hypothetical protein